MNMHLRRCATAAVLALAGSLAVATPASAGGGSELFDAPPPEETVTDEGGGSSDEQSPTDDSVIEELEPEGPPGPVGYTGVPIYEAVWAPGEIVPSQIKILKDDENVELLAFAAEDGPSLLALLVIDSADAATQYRFENAVPAGHTAALHEDGSVRFYDADGNEANGIAPPWALDAEGAEVPTSYTLDGTTLVQTVQHHGATYPVIADPWWAPIVVVVAVGACAGSVFCAVMGTAAVTLGPLVVGTAWQNQGSLTSPDCSVGRCGAALGAGLGAAVGAGGRWACRGAM